MVILSNKKITKKCSGNINNIFRSFDSRLNQNSFSTKNYNDINLGLSEAMKKYDQIGKGPLKDETGFEFYKAKEKGIIKYIKDLMKKENDINIMKMDNNIKLAQADLNDMNNMKRVYDEKERINVEKIKRLENDNLQLDSDVNELKEILDKKKNILKNLKKRNAQSLNNRNRLNQMNNNNNYINNGKADIVLNESIEEGNNNNNNNGNENNGLKTKKRQKETGCECFII